MTKIMGDSFDSFKFALIEKGIMFTQYSSLLNRVSQSIKFVNKLIIQNLHFYKM